MSLSKTLFAFACFLLPITAHTFGQVDQSVLGIQAESRCEWNGTAKYSGIAGLSICSYGEPFKLAMTRAGVVSESFSKSGSHDTACAGGRVSASTRTDVYAQLRTPSADVNIVEFEVDMTAIAPSGEGIGAGTASITLEGYSETLFRLHNWIDGTLRVSQLNGPPINIVVEGPIDAPEGTPRVHFGQGLGLIVSENTVFWPGTYRIRFSADLLTNNAIGHPVTDIDIDAKLYFEELSTSMAPSTVDLDNDFTVTPYDLAHWLNTPFDLNGDDNIDDTDLEWITHWMESQGVRWDDCNDNSFPDEVEIAIDPLLDEDTDGFLDACCDTQLDVLVPDQWLVHANRSDEFGSAVSVAGNRIAIGAPGSRVEGQHLGAIYFFEKSQSDWNLKDRTLGTTEDGLDLGTVIDTNGSFITSIDYENPLVFSVSTNGKIDSGIDLEPMLDVPIFPIRYNRRYYQQPQTSPFFINDRLYVPYSLRVGNSGVGILGRYEFDGISWSSIGPVRIESWSQYGSFAWQYDGRFVSVYKTAMGLIRILSYHTSANSGHRRFTRAVSQDHIDNVEIHSDPKLYPSTLASTYTGDYAEDHLPFVNELLGSHFDQSDPIWISEADNSQYISSFEDSKLGIKRRRICGTIEHAISASRDVGDFIFAGMPNVDGGTGRVGVYRRAKDRSGLKFVKVIQPPENLGFPVNGFGAELEVSNDSLVIGAPSGQPNMGIGGAVFVYNLSNLVGCVGDIGGDGVVDTADLGILIADFRSNAIRSDINSDGIVDTADLGLLVANFGNICD